MDESEQCPLCGAGAVTQDIEFAPELCTDCGFVIRAHDGSVEPEQTECTGVKDASQSSESPMNLSEMIAVRDSSEQNLVEVLSITETLGEALLMSSKGQIRAGEVVSKAWQENILHGRNMNAGAGAAIHIACRELGCPRPVQKIADEAEIDTSALYSTYRPLVDALSLELESPRPIDFVPFICDSLGYTVTETSAAQRFLRDRNVEMVGNPAGIAAAAVYVTLQDQDTKSTVTYREAAEAVEMTKETVWRRATELRQADTIQ